MNLPALTTRATVASSMNVPDQMRRPWEPIAPAGITSFGIMRDGLWRACWQNWAFLPKPYTVDQLQAILSVRFGIGPKTNRPAPGFVALHLVCFWHKADILIA